MVSKKIIAVFSCIAIIISCMVFPVSASGGVSGAVQTFLEWSVKSEEYVVNGFWKVIYGDDWRSADREQLQSAYTTYVTDLPASGYNSDGMLILPIPIASMSNHTSNATHQWEGQYSGNVFQASGVMYGSENALYVDAAVTTVPVDGYYTFSYDFSGTNGAAVKSVNFPAKSRTHYAAGDSLTTSNWLYIYGTSRDNLCVVSGSIHYLVEPDVSLSGDVYTVNSRPTSITGDYGIIGDNGTIVKVDGNIIVDESTSTVYNPVTNTTNNFTSWAYDYSDRSYNLTLESGDTMTVTYGDEYVTINEGDTVYNVYYLVENEPEGGGGGSGGSGSGDTHTHTYTDEITKQPTCLLSGVRTYTCSCGDSYTKTVPATGHDWQISQQVPNTYDPETGEQTQAGYTVYTCATCGEQYKSTDGQAPPNGNSSGGSSIGLGDILSGLLGVLGEILGALVGFFLTLVTKALEALSGMLDFFIQFFETIPTFFGSFIDFLAAMFPFLPEETITILNFGLILLIAAAIFRKFLK